MLKLIVGLTRHLSLGTLLIPYLVKKESEEIIQVEEQATSTFLSDNSLTEAEKEIIKLSLCYSEKNLMEVFSKEKTISGFLRKLTEERLKENIRPYIDKKQLEIIQLIRSNNIPLYYKELGKKSLYRHSLIKVMREDAEAFFHFELTEHLFRYSITCQANGEPVSLKEKKPVIILTSQPACIMAKDELLIFRDIEASRLLPFFNKNTVEVPASMTGKYMQQIVLPAMERFEVKASGIDITEEHTHRKAELSIEKSVLQQPLLRLRFLYDEHSFAPGEISQKKYVRIEERNEKFFIYYFTRDILWEEQCVKQLKDWGLKQIADSQFLLSDDAQERSLIRWIGTHKDSLQKLFELSHSESGSNYYLGEISLKQEISVKPDWFDIQIKVQIGDFHFPFFHFKKYIIKGEREFILPNGDIALLPEEWFEKYSELIALGTRQEEGIRLQKAHFKLLDELNQESFTNDLIKLQKEYIEIKEYPIPSRIKGTLRSYQKEGFSWMVHLIDNNFGGCLADDMGLGKTLQTITMLQHLYNSSESITKEVVSDPNCNYSIDKTGQLSLFGDEHVEDFTITPNDTSHQNNDLHPSTHAMKSTPTTESVSETDFHPASLVVVPTSLLPNWIREIKKFSSLSTYEYSGTGRLRSKGIKRVFNHYNVIITTYGVLRNDIELLEDYPFECVILDESQTIKNPDSVTYHSVIRLKAKHRLVLTGTPIENSLKDLWAQFNFINPGMLGSSESFRNHFIVPITKEGNTRIEARLQQLIKPFFLRRTKDQVAPELPSLTEEVRYCEMSPEQEAIYKKEKNILRNALMEISSKENIQKNSFVALQGMTRLRLMANHPRMLMPDYMFSSGKMEQILEAYEMLMSEGHKVLIFSSFVKYLHLLGEAFERNGWQYALLTGQTTDREKEIARFTNEKDIYAFFISLKAGGVGLNLTEADYVFIIDPWWNPAAEMQAVSRAHRIGQTKQVMVYRFITSDTIEEKIIRLQEKKSKLAESFITSNNPLKSFNNKEWKELLNIF
jgi:SNF2 family DNA or RNA helicase